MRLGQLSRQLEISSEQIVKLISENFREVNNHPNIKISEEELEFLNDRFAPKEEIQEVPQEIEAAVIEEAKEPLKEVETSEVPEFIEELRPQVISLEDEFHAQTEDLESYKAEKPHLEGLKVVGKIDLPEPIVKEKEENPEEKDDLRKARNERVIRQRKERSERRTNALLEEKKKAKRLAIKKKFEEEERLKNLKKKHYEEHVKAKIKPVAPRKKKVRVEETGSAPAVPYSSPAKKANSRKPIPKQRAKNPIKRFWLWLNGAYDN